MQSHQNIVDNYVIYYYESVGCGGSSPVTVTIAGTNYTLNGLEENTGYGATITAVNSAGLSTSAVFLVYTSATSKSDKASLCLRFRHVLQLLVFYSMDELFSLEKNSIL